MSEMITIERTASDGKVLLCSMSAEVVSVEGSAKAEALADLVLRNYEAGLAT